METETRRTGSTKDKITEDALNNYQQALEDAEDIVDADMVMEKLPMERKL